MQVLFVDDDESVRLSAEALLEGAGIAVVLAKDATDCLRILSDNHCVRLVITDFQMDGMNGAELFREVQARFDSCPPFILLTGCAQLPVDDVSLPWERILEKGAISGAELVALIRNRTQNAA